MQSKISVAKPRSSPQNDPLDLWPAAARSMAESDTRQHVFPMEVKRLDPSPGATRRSGTSCPFSSR